MKSTDEMERDVLAVLAREPDTWFNHFAPEVAAACDGNLDAAMAVCKQLRKKKKVDADGTGKWAQYAHKLPVKS